MIKIILISILILTIIGAILFGIILFKTWNKKEFDKIIAAAGLGWTIFSVIITCLISLYSIKEPKLDISFVDGRYIDRFEDISLLLNNDNSLEMDTSPDYTWGIVVNNNGNKSLDKLRVKIKFDNLYFYDINDAYRLVDGRYALGGYSSIIYETDEWIPPQQKMVMPLIDFSGAMIEDNSRDVYMYVNTYTEDDVVSTFKYKILINDNI